MRLAGAWLARLTAWLLLLGAGPSVTIGIAAMCLGMLEKAVVKGTLIATGIVAVAWYLNGRAVAEIRRQAVARQEQQPRGFEVIRPGGASQRRA